MPSGLEYREVSIHLTRQICPPASSFPSPGCRSSYRRNDFKTSQRYSQMQHGNCRPCQNKPDQRYIEKLKEIIQSNLKVLQFSCNRFCPGYFLSARIFSRSNTAISIDTVNTVTFLFNVLQFGICCHLKFGFYDPKSIITVQNFLYLRYFFILC
jgi:hypothetical protein